MLTQKNERRPAMKKSKTIKIILAFMTTFSMMFANINCVWATDKSSVNMDIDNVMRKWTLDEKQTEDVYEDMKLLSEVGVSIENIEEIRYDSENIIYSLPVSADVVDEIKIEKNNNDIVMNVVEGNIENELVIKSNGEIFLDGKEVIIINETFNERSVQPLTGGITWYSSSKAPSYLKTATYGSYSESWRCSSVNLQKSLGNIAYSTFIGLVTSGGVGGAIGFTSAAFYELVNYDPNSKSISYIDYLARCSANARYYKSRRYTYTRKNFGGKRTITFAFGLMM